MISLLLLLLSPGLQAQCVVNPPSTQQGFYPNPAPDGCVGQNYDEVIQFVFPLDTTVVLPPFGTFVLPFDSFRVDSITMVPNGITVSINNANGKYYPVSATVPARGCADIFGLPTVASPPMSTIEVYVTAWTTAPIVGVQVGQSTFELDFQINNAPVAAFTNNVSGNTANFTDGSTGATSWAWDFGDGNTSTLGSPSHTYANNGNYNVCLIASNGPCSDTTCTVVQVGCPAPTAAYSANSSGLTANFTDQTIANGTSWFWDFGDGNTSTTQNPTHTYSSPGVYTVCMTISDNCGTDSTCQSIRVCEPLTPAVNLVPTGLTVAYTGSTASGTPSGYFWDFGDGNTSTMQNGSHTYASPGIYLVCLFAYDQCDSVFICPNVQVCAVPVAGFSFQSTGNGLDFDFTDASTGQTLTWAWDFGDGNSSTAVNPSHTYAADGNYTVCLTISDSCGVNDTLCQSLTVTNLAPGIGVKQLKVYPNPATENVNIHGELANSDYLEFTVSDLSGRVLKQTGSQEQGSFQKEINLEGLASGLYLLEIKNSQGRLVQRLLKE